MTLTELRAEMSREGVKFRHMTAASMFCVVTALAMLAAGLVALAVLLWAWRTVFGG